MKDNTIVDKLARTIERKELNNGIVPLPFIYADIDMQNVLIDNTGAPFAAAAPVTTTAVQDEHGFYHERATFEIYFGDVMTQALPDYDARENERILDMCKQRAFKWLSMLYPADELKLVTVNSMRRTYLKFDAITTGYLLSVTLEERQGYGKCDNLSACK